jgi:hypothetical protein
MTRARDLAVTLVLVAAIGYGIRATIRGIGYAIRTGTRR